jgi:hypothetical protein
LRQMVKKMGMKFIFSPLLLMVLTTLLPLHVSSQSTSPSTVPSHTPQVFVSSALGEPLKAIVFFEPGGVNSVQLAPASEYAARGLDLPAVEHLQFDFKHDGQRPFLKVQSDKPYDTPARTLLFSIKRLDGSSFIQEHTLLLDLPGTTSESTVLLPSSTIAVPSSQATPSSGFSDLKSITPVSKPALATLSSDEALRFNRKLGLINKRLSTLEAGQAQLFHQFSETDKKLSALIDKFEAKSIAKPDSKPVATPVLTPTAIPTVTPVGPSNPTSSPQTPLTESVAVPSPAKKRIILPPPPPPPEPSFLEGLLTDPLTLYGGGGLFVLLLLLALAWGVKKYRRPFKFTASNTVFGQTS